MSEHTPLLSTRTLVAENDKLLLVQRPQASDATGAFSFCLLQ